MLTICKDIKQNVLFRFRAFSLFQDYLSLSINYKHFKLEELCYNILYVEKYFTHNTVRKEERNNEM